MVIYFVIVGGVIIVDATLYPPELVKKDQPDYIDSVEQS